MTAKDLRSGNGSQEGDHVFVLRFWLERDAGPGATVLWRAKVTELNGQARHANSVDDALTLVRHQMARASESRAKPRC